MPSSQDEPAQEQQPMIADATLARINQGVQLHHHQGQRETARDLFAQIWCTSTWLSVTASSAISTVPANTSSMRDHGRQSTPIRPRLDVGHLGGHGARLPVSFAEGTFHEGT
jgi:hypothetical protein